MPLRVSLRDVVDDMQVFSEEITAYINRKTGERTSIGDEEARMVEDDEPTDDLPAWQQELLPNVREVLGSDDFLPEMINDLDPEKSQSVMKAMLQMKKIDIDKLKRAYAG